MKIIKLRYSIEPRDRIYVQGYRFLSFAKNIGKSLSNKCSKKLLDSAKKSTADAIKIASKRATQKTAEATGDLIGNKLADKITSISKKPVKELRNNDETEEGNVEITRKIYISPEDRQQIIDQLRLIPKNFDSLQYIKIEYQKIENLFDNASNQPSKFRTRNWVEIND